MMSRAETNNFVSIAKILKSNGVTGDIVISFREYSPEDLNEEEPVFISFDGLLVPFFITNQERRGNKRLIIHLKGIENLEAAEELISKELFVEVDGIEEENSIIDWSVYDKQGALIGKVISIEDIPSNPCICVQNPSGKEFILPLHDDLILDINEDNQSISLIIPEGCLDL